MYCHSEPHTVILSEAKDLERTTGIQRTMLK